jgi:hypothetical protein
MKNENDDSELKKACDEVEKKAKDAEAEREQRRLEHQKKAEEAMRARSETLKKLREIGLGLSMPTEFRPHLCSRKLGKDEKEAPIHGVQFRRDGKNCLVEAQNGIAAVSIALLGEAEQCPKEGANVPARAMALIASAEAEFAQVWFHAGKVTVLVDDAVHEFFQIPRDLPFPIEDLRKRPRARLVQSATFDAEQLHRIQKALATGHVALRQADKHLLSVWPEGNDRAPSCGFLSTFADEGDK